MKFAGFTELFIQICWSILNLEYFHKLLRYRVPNLGFQYAEMWKSPFSACD